MLASERKEKQLCSFGDETLALHLRPKGGHEKQVDVKLELCLGSHHTTGL